VQRGGQSQWQPAAVGAKLVEGDDIRAPAGGSAELALADGSTLILAENSRLHITRLEYDPQTQARSGLFHLAVGKVKSVVSQAAITLVRARQSNFAISTPTAVAAARGTVFVTIYDERLQEMALAVLAEDPGKTSIVNCFGLNSRTGITAVRDGLYSVATLAGCTAPIPIPDLGIDSTRNSMPLGPGYYGAIRPVTPGQAFGAPTAAAPLVGTTNASAANTNSYGRDQTVNQSFTTDSTSPANP